jgi:hypothetical protein
MAPSSTELGSLLTVRGANGAKTPTLTKDICAHTPPLTGHFFKKEGGFAVSVRDGVYMQTSICKVSDFCSICPTKRGHALDFGSTDTSPKKVEEDTDGTFIN